MSGAPRARKRRCAISLADVADVRGPLTRRRRSVAVSAPGPTASLAAIDRGPVDADVPNTGAPSWPILSEVASIMRMTEAEAMPTARKMLRRALVEGRLRCACGGFYWNIEAACRCAMTYAREDAERYLTAQHQDAAALGMWLQRGQLRPSCGCSDGGWVCAGSGFGGSSHVLPCHHAEETWLHTLPMSGEQCQRTCFHGRSSSTKLRNELWIVGTHLRSHQQSETKLQDFISIQLRSAQRSSWFRPVPASVAAPVSRHFVDKLCNDGRLSSRVHSCMVAGSSLNAATLAHGSRLGYFYSFR